MIRAEVAPQNLVRPTGEIGTLDKHGREVVRDLGGRRPPDGDVPGIDGHAVGLDVTKEDEFMLGGYVFDEEARALVGPQLVLAMTDRHATHGDVGEYRLVFTISVESRRRHRIRMCMWLAPTSEFGGAQ